METNNTKNLSDEEGNPFTNLFLLGKASTDLSSYMSTSCAADLDLESAVNELED